MTEAAKQAELTKQAAVEEQVKADKQKLDLAIARQIASAQERINAIRQEENEGERSLHDANKRLQESSRQLDTELAKTGDSSCEAAAAHCRTRKTQVSAEANKTSALQYQTSKWQSTLKECMNEAKKDKEALRRNMAEERRAALEAAETDANSRIDAAISRTKEECAGAEAEAMKVLESKHQQKMKDLAARKQAALELAVERQRDNAAQQLKQQSLDHEDVLRQRESAHKAALRGAQQVAQARQRAAVETLRRKLRQRGCTSSSCSRVETPRGYHSQSVLERSGGTRPCAEPTQSGDRRNHRCGQDCKAESIGRTFQRARDGSWTTQWSS